MIYYFSGTHNSRHVAEMLASILKTECEFIPDSNPKEALCQKQESLGFVFPVYSWGVPPIVIDFIRRLPHTFIEKANADGIPVWAAMTCGDETALAPEMLSKVLAEKGLRLSGVWSVIMPNNYVLLPGFDVDSKNVEHHKLDEAPARVKAIAEDIMSGNWRTDVIRGSWPRLKTKLIYPLFKRWGIFPKKWNWNQECVSCGKCFRVCPVGNITMVSDHPRWGNDCVSCLACYHVCPTHAVNYGSITKTKGQYFCRRKLPTNLHTQ